MNHSRVFVEAGSGETSSIQTKANSPAAAGQYPSQAGSGRHPAAASSCSARQDTSYTVRSGLTTRHTGPNSSDAAGRPTQNTPYT
jgi:hypothetical protein